MRGQLHWSRVQAARNAAQFRPRSTFRLSQQVRQASNELRTSELKKDAAVDELKKDVDDLTKDVKRAMNETEKDVRTEAQKTEAALNELKKDAAVKEMKREALVEKERAEAAVKQTAASAASGARSGARSGFTRARNFVYGTTLVFVLGFGYLYVTDTRATAHQWLVPRVLRTLYPDAEDAHHAGNKSLKALYALGLHPRERGNPDAKGDLRVEVFGHILDNPIGTSAGLDKNAEIPDVVLGLGAGLVEVGGITPHPQEGNAKPRVWRVPSQNALINRYGLNSEGAESVAVRLRQRLREFSYACGFGLDPEAEKAVLDGEAGVPPGSQMPGRLLAVQIAKMKETPDNDINAIAQDYVYCVDQLAKYADILVVNVSSPNTPGLRNLQQAAPLTKILTSVVDAARAADRKTAPAVMVKVSPDEDTEEQVRGICGAVWASGVDGIIVGNTTKKRPDPLPKGYMIGADEQSIMLEMGGYSGPQMFERTLSLVKKYRNALDEGPPQEVKPQTALPPKQKQNEQPQQKEQPKKVEQAPTKSEVPSNPIKAQTAAPNTLDKDTATSIDASVERDLQNLKPMTSEADSDSGSQAIIQIPERHIPDSLSSSASEGSNKTLAAETKAAFSAVEPGLGASTSAATETMSPSSPTSVSSSSPSSPSSSLSQSAAEKTRTIPASAAPTNAARASTEHKEKIIFATGGITNGKQALEVLNAGASVAMVYTAMVYGGAGTITRIKKEMREEIGNVKKD